MPKYLSKIVGKSNCLLKKTRRDLFRVSIATLFMFVHNWK